MRIFLKTIGCRVNQYETELIRERLLAGGDSAATDDYETADLCVVNTCAVTREADKDSLQIVRRIARRNPGARLVVTGCLATRAPESVRDSAPDALVFPNERKADIPAELGCPSGALAVTGLSGHSRAFVKVQDGCDMRCTYCVVPSVRPRLSSKPYDALEREVRGLVERGYLEIVLCGVRMGRYRAEHPDGGRMDMAAMLERLLDRIPGFRIRLSSLEITDVGTRLLDLLSAAHGRLAPSFHLPLQSGSDAVLKRMGRWYSTSYFERRLDAIRKRRPDAGLFTDVMVAFPGETEAEHAESLEFVRRMGFSGLHVFRFSSREGTPAARLPDRLSEGTALRRARSMRALDRTLRRRFARSAVGSRRLAVVERSEGKVEAVTDHFLRVSLDRDPGSGLHRVLIAEARGSRARATVVPEMHEFMSISKDH